MGEKKRANFLNNTNMKRNNLTNSKIIKLIHLLTPLSGLTMLNLKTVMQNKNSILLRNNSTNSTSGLNEVSNLENNSLDNNKSLINPESFLESRKIEGPVLDSGFPKDVSPWFLTGFIDAEGSFDISLFSNVRALAKTGVKFRFRVSANYRDVVLVCAIRNYFGSGAISLIRKDTSVISLEISSIETIKNIIYLFLMLIH